MSQTTDPTWCGSGWRAGLWRALSGDTAPQTYVLSRWLFLRLLGVVYLIAFASLGVQVTGLVGEHGVLPAGEYLAQVHAALGGAAYRLFPTLCWLGAGDAALQALCWGGVALAAAAIAGVAQAPIFALLWAFYLSLSVAGQTFLSFQWDTLLLEAGLLAVFYAPTGWLPSLARQRRPSTAVRWLLWWLLFRLMFLSGATKLASGDPTWRRLTALDYHFETQPLPPWTAWYAAHLPSWIHAQMTLAVLVAELVVPWLIFVPPRLRPLRLLACALLVLAQIAIAGTGNYGFFNLLAVVLCVPVLDDGVWRRILPLAGTAGESEPRGKRVAIGVLAPAVLLLSTLACVREIRTSVPGIRGESVLPHWSQALLDVTDPFRSINGYGLFRVMTTERPEVVIEGSADGAHWVEYQFRWKPGALTRRPGFVAPHQPRLDWQMWFAALDPRGNADWLVSLMERLLQGTPEVLALLDGNPFPAGPPRYVRLAYYRYRFTTPEERAHTGAWWERDFRGYLTPPLSLRSARPRS